MSGDVDVPRRDVDVHQVVDDPGLDVALVFVDEDFLSGVEDLNEAEVRLGLLVDGLVLKLVVLDPFAKVLHDVV